MPVQTRTADADQGAAVRRAIGRIRPARNIQDLAGDTVVIIKKAVADIHHGLRLNHARLGDFGPRLCLC